MGDQTKNTRRSYRWSKEARELLAEFIDENRRRDAKAVRRARRSLLDKLTEITGYPRHACARFVRQGQENDAASGTRWTREEKQKLLNLMDIHTLEETAWLLRRSRSSVRTMLHRLGASAQMGKDWFTKHSLATALRVPPQEVQRWVDLGWLKCRVVETDGIKRELLDGDLLAEFCRKHIEQIKGRRIDPHRLDFVLTYIFPPAHSDLLPVRESKKERTAFDEQVKGHKIPPRGDSREDEAEMTA